MVLVFTSIESLLTLSFSLFVNLLRELRGDFLVTIGKLLTTQVFIALRGRGELPAMASKKYGKYG